MPKGKGTTKYYICDAGKFAQAVTVLAATKDGVPCTSLAEARKANRDSTGETIVVGVPQDAVSKSREITRQEVQTSSFTLPE